jgi:hypothetical protein
LANTLGISISESFLQLGLKDSEASEPNIQSYFLPKVPLPRAIEDFFSKNSSSGIATIRLHLKSTRFILNRHLGVAPAVLVTAGFEDWLNMNLPLVESHFRLHPNRVESPIDRDLVFGVSERVSFEGKNLTEVSQDELEFLASKLKMLKVQNVAICFLHSQKNEQNLKTAMIFLQQQGFQVFATPANVEDEKARWWTSILAAYLQPFYEEFLQQLRETLPSELRDIEIEVSVGQGFAPSSQLFPMSSLFGEALHIHNKLKSVVGIAGRVIHFGFEDFYSLDLAEGFQTYWPSAYGNVAMTIPKIELLDQQPTALLENNFWGVPSVAKQTVGFEPGPMCLGRGLRPTFLDLLFLTGELQSSPFLGRYFNEKSRGRIKESLISMCEDPQKELTGRDIINDTLELAIRRILMQISLNEKNHFMGPLATFFRMGLKKLQPNLKIEVIDQKTSLPISTLLETDL